MGIVSKKIKINDTVSFIFAGSKMKGTVICLYTRSSIKMATIKNHRGYKYPIKVESLTKL